jgi:hypothetical protein
MRLAQLAITLLPIAQALPLPLSEETKTQLSKDMGGALTSAIFTGVYAGPVGVVAGGVLGGLTTHAATTLAKHSVPLIREEAKRDQEGNAAEAEGQPVPATPKKWISEKTKYRLASDFIAGTSGASLGGVSGGTNGALIGGVSGVVINEVVTTYMNYKMKKKAMKDATEKAAAARREGIEYKPDPNALDTPILEGPAQQELINEEMGHLRNYTKSIFGSGKPKETVQPEQKDKFHFFS